MSGDPTAHYVALAAEARAMAARPYIPTLAELAELLAESSHDYRRHGKHDAADALMDFRATVQSMLRYPPTNPG